jgi:ribonuclease Y
MLIWVAVILGVGGGIVVGGGAAWLTLRLLDQRKLESANAAAARIRAEAEKEASHRIRDAELQAKDYLYQAKTEFEKESKTVRAELQGIQERLLRREENLDKKVDMLDQKELELGRRDKNLVQKEKGLSDLEAKQQGLIKEAAKKLEEVAGLSATEAKNQLMENMLEEARHEAGKKIKQIEDEARETAERESKKILSLAIERYAGDYVAERTVSVVTLPSDEMKGRIIGREGRNIRALEAATGIDLIVDDTPEAVVLSGFNSVRREVARLALERLITDGRIHPARIEEVVKKVEKEVDERIREAGQQATFDVGVHGIHPELIKLVGRLRYRTSYAQNQYTHALEVAFLVGIMASELNLNVKRAKRAGLLHDIGKAVDHEVEGSHAQIGADLAKKFGEAPQVVQAIAGHHDDEPGSLLGNLIQAADALSGARPGARREMLETYVKRLEDLEKIANSFSGIGNSFAIQAGREIRIMVESDKISDADALILSKDIARKIEKELTYPGQIKVTVIRETRAVEMAK